MLVWTKYYWPFKNNCSSKNQKKFRCFQAKLQKSALQLDLIKAVLKKSILYLAHS